MKKKSKQSKREQQIWNQIKADRASARKEYFEKGGEACRWNGGLHLVTRVRTYYKRKNKWGDRY